MDTIINFIRICVFQLLDLLPYVIGGVVLGEVLKLASWSKSVYKVVNKSSIVSIILAAILGIASPICTYGTVPLCIQLYKSGVKLSPLISFLCASTLLNPQMIIYTVGMISPLLAILRIVTTFIVAVVIGLVFNYMDDKKQVKSSFELDEALQKDIECKPTIKRVKILQFLKNCWDSFEYIIVYMSLGVVISVLIEQFVPSSQITNLFASKNWYSVILAGLLGVPLYQCGGVTIPIISAMMETGMGIGQALTFFLVGPASNASPILAMASILKTKSVVIYMSILIGLSILIGYITPLFVG